MTPHGYKLGRNDRITIDGARYRPDGKRGRVHLLRHVVKDAILDDAVKPLTDDELAGLIAGNLIRIEAGYYSKAYQLLAGRAEGTNLSELHDLDDKALRTIAWKVEWCTRYNLALAGLDGHARRWSKTPDDMGAFIAAERETMHRWYVDTFGVSRPPGREIAGQRRKTYDWPGSTTLRGWMTLLEAGGGQPGVFRLQYAKCGNRNQIDPRAIGIVRKHVDRFASGARGKPGQLHAAIEADLRIVNRGLPEGCHVSVGQTAVRRRINKLPPILIDLGNLGDKPTELKYAPVGKGLHSLDGLTPIARMDRVEMDDWEMDLFTILKDKRVRTGLGRKAKDEARRLRKNRVTVRCTVTVAIDVVTKCVVGLHVTPFSPSAAGSKSALRSIVVDKGPLAKLAGANSEWPMSARPVEVATDGGPAFKGDFHETLGRLQVEHRLPGGDPRSRGTIESFFKNFKALCRMFTGQSFSNVVEKGDYQSQELASLMSEDVLLRVVRYVVDIYHHTPHSGLGGMRPYEAWRRADNDMDPVPDHMARQLAFGLAVPNRVVAADGVTYLHTQYKHPDMGKLRALIGDVRFGIVTDPNDMGTILVRVPKEAREHFPDHGAYLAFTAPDLAGVTLAEYLRGNRNLLRFQRQERLAGNPFRLTAIQDLMRQAEEARRKAGVPSDVVSEDQLRRMLRLVERKGAQAVANRPAPSGPRMTGEIGPGSLGVSLAAPGHGPRHPSRPVSDIPGADSLTTPPDLDFGDDE
jgi:transposase InsO family protein